MSSTKPTLSTTLTWKTAAEGINSGKLNARSVQKVIDDSKICPFTVFTAIAVIVGIGALIVCILNSDMTLGISLGGFFGIIDFVLIKLGIDAVRTCIQARKTMKNDDKTGNSYLAELLTKDLEEHEKYPTECEKILMHLADQHAKYQQSLDDRKKQTAQDAMNLRAFLSGREMTKAI